MADFFELFVIINMKSTLFDNFDFSHWRLFLIKITWGIWIVGSGRLKTSWLLIIAGLSFHFYVSIGWLAVLFIAQFHSCIFFWITKFGVIASRGELIYLRSCCSVSLAIIMILHTILIVWRFVVSNLGRMRINHILVITDAWWPILSLPRNVAVILVALFIRCLECALGGISICHFSCWLIGVAVLTELLHLLLFLHKGLLVRFLSVESICFWFQPFCIIIITTTHRWIFISHF